MFIVAQWRQRGLFVVHAEGMSTQVNYLINEAVSTGKGAKCVVSYLHHFLQHYGISEKEMHLHADSRADQNNNFFSRYGTWCDKSQPSACTSGRTHHWLRHRLGCATCFNYFRETTGAYCRGRRTLLPPETRRFFQQHIVLLREVVPYKAYCAAERSCAAQGILCCWKKLCRTRHIVLLKEVVPHKAYCTAERNTVLPIEEPHMWVSSLTDQLTDRVSNTLSVPSHLLNCLV